MKPTLRIYVPLEEGTCAELTVSVIKEALPAPHEACAIREPGVSEFAEIRELLHAGKYSTIPPFPIERPTAPTPEQARAIFDDLNRRFNPNDGTFDPEFP